MGQNDITRGQAGSTGVPHDQKSKQSSVTQLHWANSARDKLWFPQHFDKQISF